MKVYGFFMYLKRDKINEFPIFKKYIDETGLDSSYSNKIRILYAFTNKKSIRDRFYKTRNMKIFGKSYMTMDMTKEEYDAFYDMYGGKNIVVMHYKDRLLRKEGDGNIILTEDELSYVQFDYFERDFFSDYINDLPPLEIFKEEYKESLRVLNYPLEGLFDYTDLNLNGIIFNELNLFIKIFGNTLNEEFYT